MATTTMEPACWPTCLHAHMCTPHRPRDARFAIWSRIDQKTCLKAITAAGARGRALRGEKKRLRKQ